MSASLISLVRLPGQVAKCRPIVDGYENNARRSKFSCLYSSHTRTPSGFHNNKSSSTDGLRYTSISLPGCLGPWISSGINIYFLFMHSQEGRLTYKGSQAMYCDCSPTHRMDSFHLYLNQTLCSLGRCQNLGIVYPRFSTETHLQGVSSADLAYAFLCATAST